MEILAGLLVVAIFAASKIITYRKSDADTVIRARHRNIDRLARQYRNEVR